MKRRLVRLGMWLMLRSWVPMRFRVWLGFRVFHALGPIIMYTEERKP